MLYLVGMALVAELWLLLQRSDKKRNLNCKKSGLGSLYVYGILCGLVLTELERFGYGEKVPMLKKIRKKRTVLTVCYILSHFLLLFFFYHKTAAIYGCILLSFIYVLLLHKLDPLDAFCEAVKQQPDRDISEVVKECLEDRVERPVRLLGIAAFALSLLVVVSANLTGRYVFEYTWGDYAVKAYKPAIIGQEHIQIPETYRGQPVVAIGKRAFMDCRTIKQLTIPETVTLIDSYAFKNCVNLQSVQLPEGLQTLNGESFKNCKKLEEITIPQGVTEIRGNTFEDCKSLKTVNLHDGIVDIHAYAFRNCSSLEQITLPANITEIHAYTFEHCSSLKRIEIPDGVTKIATHAFNDCSSLEYVYVPDTVEEIRSYAFGECDSLREIELPAGIFVKENAFEYSPTQVIKKNFSDTQWELICQEIFQKEIDGWYYIYEVAEPDAVYEWETETILLVDDVRFLERYDENYALQKITTNEELLPYLEKAKAGGMVQIQYAIYSTIGSEILGEDHFVGAAERLDEKIEEVRQAISEETDE